MKHRVYTYNATCLKIFMNCHCSCTAYPQ